MHRNIKEGVGETDPSAGTMDYIASPLKNHAAPAAGGNDDDVDIPDTILWDLAGGNIAETGALGSEDSEALPREIDGPDEGNGLCDIVVHDDDDDSGDPDSFEWVIAGGAERAAARGPVESFDLEELIDIMEPDMPSAPDGRVEHFDHEELGDIAGRMEGPNPTDLDIKDPDDIPDDPTASEGPTAPDPSDRDRVDSYDHETLEDTIEPGGSSETEPGRAMAFAPGNPDGGQAEPGVDMVLIIQGLASGTDTLPVFDVENIVEGAASRETGLGGGTDTIVNFELGNDLDGEPPIEPWVDLA